MNQTIEKRTRRERSRRFYKNVYKVGEILEVPDGENIVVFGCPFDDEETQLEWGPHEILEVSHEEDDPLYFIENGDYETTIRQSELDETDRANCRMR
tara:strand:+ start:363 stop:653 length:291 start_codon:yes stop_codon:yes gene_type:complete